MAQYGRPHAILISETIEILRNQVQRDMFDGNVGPTRIKSYSLSGVISAFTEEIVYTQSHTWDNVSGIIHPIQQGDDLLGLGGKVKIGDMKVLYHYNSVSGILANRVMSEIEVLLPAASGIYFVAGHTFSSLAGQPIFMKVALTLDRNA